MVVVRERVVVRNRVGRLVGTGEEITGGTAPQGRVWQGQAWHGMAWHGRAPAAAHPSPAHATPPVTAHATPPAHANPPAHHASTPRTFKRRDGTAAGAGSLPQPSEKDVWPPGGACRRVVERSVMTLPQFWLEPFAKALLKRREWRRKGGGEVTAGGWEAAFSEDVWECRERIFGKGAGVQATTGKGNRSSAHTSEAPAHTSGDGSAISGEDSELGARVRVRARARARMRAGLREKGEWCTMLVTPPRRSAAPLRRAARGSSARCTGARRACGADERSFDGVGGGSVP